MLYVDALALYLYRICEARALQASTVSQSATHYSSVFTFLLVICVRNHGVEC